MQDLYWQAKASVHNPKDNINTCSFILSYKGFTPHDCNNTFLDQREHYQYNSLAQNNIHIVYWEYRVWTNMVLEKTWKPLLVSN